MSGYDIYIKVKCRIQRGGGRPLKGVGGGLGVLESGEESLKKMHEKCIQTTKFCKVRFQIYK